MRSLMLIALVLTAIASVHGGLLSPMHKNPAWMTIRGEDGSTNLVLLNAPNYKGKAIDPPNDVKFYLYTRSNRNNPAQIMVGNLQGGPFDGARNTKFIAHGFTASGFDSWIIDMKNEFLDDEDCNVVAVDWQGPASGPLYNDARGNVNEVGAYVGEMYTYLATQGSANRRTHCIGHSLGSHVCGLSGKGVSNLDRITGMDPAMPLFSIDNPSARLAVGDASYVHVIHTCGGWLGFGQSLGDSDFYPNGGEASQPGCGLDVSGSCSHGRAYEFMIESISSSAFRARQCGSWANFQSGSCNNNDLGIMGNPSSASLRGDFYLATSDASPYALG